MTTSDPNVPTPQVTTGTRRDETHYETDAGQQVRAAHLTKPDEPLPREDGTTLGGQQPLKPGEPIADVTVDAAESSVWDARPPEGRAFQDVPDSGPPQASLLSEGRDAASGGDWAPGYEGAEADTPDAATGKPPFPPSELVSKRAG